MNSLQIIYFILFAFCAVFAHVYPMNTYFGVWLFSCTCIFIGVYLISGLTNPLYLYLALCILYIISLSVFLTHNFNTIKSAILITLLCIVGVAILFRILTPVFMNTSASGTNSNNPVANLPTSIMGGISLLSNIPITQFVVIFIIGIILTGIVLSQYYKFPDIISSMLVIVLLFSVMWWVNSPSYNNNIKTNNTVDLQNILFTYNSLYFLVFVGIMLFIYSIKYMNIPDINNLFIYGIICSVVFGFKHVLFNNSVPPNIFMVVVLLIIFGCIYLSFSSSLIPYSNKNMVLYGAFTILCILLSMLLGNVSTYIPFVIFILSTIITIFFSISKYSINTSILTYVSVFGLMYFIINGLNHIDYLQVNQFKYKLLWIYLIICGLLLYLYFFVSDKLHNSDFKANSPVLSFISTVITFIGVSLIGLFSTIDDNKNAIFLFWISLAILLSIYYFFNKSIYHNTNYIIIACIIYYLICFSQYIINIPNKLLFSASFILLITLIWFITHFWDKFKKTRDYNSETSIYYLSIILLFVSFVCSCFFYIKSTDPVTNSNAIFSKMTYLVTIMFLVALAIYYIITLFKKGSSNSKIYSIIFIFIIFYIIVKLVKANNPTSASKYPLVYDIIEYLPCLYDQSVSNAIQLPTAVSNVTDSSVNVISFYLILGIIICIVFYKYGYPYYKKHLYTSGHTLIDNNPLPLDNPKLIITSDALKAIGFNPYNFGISFNLYLYPIPANNTDFTILTFSNYLYVQYNSYLNHITIWKQSSGKLKQNNILIYRHINVPLQTLVKYEINFINGICDVFINNSLITSHNNIIVTDNLNLDVTLGTSDKQTSVIQGKINNFMLFNYPLNLFQISMIK